MNITILREKIRLYGIYGAFVCFTERVLSKYLHISIHKYFIYGKEISTKGVYSHKKEYEVRELCFKDFVEQRLLARDWFNKWKMNNIRYALKDCNNYAIGMFDNNLLIGYVLADFKRFIMFNNDLSDEDVYFWDVYVHKNYRGKAICQDLYNTLIEKSLQLGKRRALSYVDSYNKASHKTHKKQQYRILQKVVTINGWGIRYSSLKLPI